MTQMPECLVRLAAAIVAMKTLRLAYSGWKPGVMDDLYLRARILEGAADLPKWSLSGNPRKFIKEGPALFPNVAPEWFSGRDTGLADHVYYTLQGMVTQGDRSSRTAEELYQELVSGAGRTGDKDLGSYVSGDFAQKILMNGVVPGQLKPGIRKIVQHKALESMRKDKKYHGVPVGPTDDSDDADASLDPADVVDMMSPMQAIALIMSGPQGREFLNWAYKIVESRGSDAMKAVFDAYVSNPSASNGQLAEGYAAVMGESISPQMAGRHRDNALKLIKDAISKNPTVLDWVQDALAMKGIDDVDAVELARLPLRWQGRRASGHADLRALAASLPPGNHLRREVLVTLVVAGVKAQKRFEGYVKKSRTLRDPGRHPVDLTTG